jgi:hypothetical protein
MTSRLAGDAQPPGALRAAIFNASNAALGYAARNRTAAV